MGVEGILFFGGGVNERECIICKGDATFLGGNDPSSLLLCSRRIELRIEERVILADIHLSWRVNLEALSMCSHGIWIRVKRIKVGDPTLLLRF